MSRSLVICLVVVLASLLGGCPPPPPVQPLPVPPPISLGRQVGQLNARAALATGLRARGKVTITWTDENGRHSHDADGKLLLRQETPANAAAATQPAPAADVVLIGQFAGNDVFELGSNPQRHWMAIRLDTNKAWVARVGGPGEKRLQIRAADVLDVLAVSRLYDTSRQHLAMIVRDAPEPPVNELFVLRTTAAGGTWVQRIQVVNRRTGQVDEVRLYFPDGTLQAVATLRQYAPAAGTDGAAAPALPREVQITYPSAQAQVHLRIDSWKAVPDLDPAMFTMPEFRSQGLEVIDLDAPPPPAARP